MQVLGVDVGGTGIKGAIVDTQNGVLLTGRYRVATPQPATPEAVAETLAEIVRHFEWNGPVGAGFPSVIQNGVARTAANVDKSFIGTNLETLFSKYSQCPVSVANDADVAGLAEYHFGEGRGQKGLVLMVTLGTGIGTALINDSVLLPNTELGHIWLANGQEAEAFAANSVRKNEGLSWQEWGERVGLYLQTMEQLFFPDLIILGGGVSKYFDQFQPYLNVNTPVKTASFLNQAGIVGAAMLAFDRM